jgi:hypothetical protein
MLPATMLSQTYGGGHHGARGLGQGKMFRDARMTQGFSLYGDRRINLHSDLIGEAPGKFVPVDVRSLYKFDH